MDAISGEACSTRTRVKTRPARHYIARWTPEEDAILLEHVMLHGTSQWGLLQRSNRLPLRDNKACCNRFILLKKKFIEQDGSPSAAGGVFPMGSDPVSSSPPSGALSLPPLALSPPVGEPHHWSATAASALYSVPRYHSLGRGNQQHSPGSSDHPSRGSYQHSIQNSVITGMGSTAGGPTPHHHHHHHQHLSARGLVPSSTTLPHSPSVNSMEAFSFIAPHLPFSSPQHHQQQHPSSVPGGVSIPGKSFPAHAAADVPASAPSPHRPLPLDVMPSRKSSPRLVVELTGDWGFTAADGAAVSAAAACSDNSTSLSANPSRASLAPHHAAFAASAFPRAQQPARPSTALSPCAAPRTPRGPQAVAAAAPPGAGTPPVAPLGAASLGAAHPAAGPPAVSSTGSAPPGSPTLRGVQQRPSASQAPRPLPTAAVAAASPAPAGVRSVGSPTIVRGEDGRARKRARVMGAVKEEWEETMMRPPGDGTEMSDETPAMLLLLQQQQRHRNSMNHGSNTVPSSPALPASPAAIPSAAYPARPAARFVDAPGVFFDAGCDLSTRDSAFAGRNCANWPAESAGVAEECHEAHSSIANAINVGDTAAAGVYPVGSVLVPDPELLACLNSLTSCLSWPDLTLLDAEAAAGHSTSMMGRLGLDMGELIDGCEVPREDGEVPALRPDFLLEMMSSG
ncbi:unnamed protein product [Closterium sp. NIES-53]